VASPTVAYPGTSLAGLGAEDKRIATAQARAALAGIEVHVIDADDGRSAFIATRAAMTRQFADIGEMEQWLDGQESST